MSDMKRKRSDPATHGGTGEREVNKHRPRDTDRVQKTSSSTRSKRGNRQQVLSSVSPSGTAGGTLSADHIQAHLPPGWKEADGYWYYPTPDGKYHMWHNVDSPGNGTGEYMTSIGNDQGPVGQDMSVDRAYPSWDASSRRPNQGSAYFDSTQGATDVDTDHQHEESYRQQRQAQFLKSPGPWTTLDVVSHADGAALQRSANGGTGSTGHGEVPGLSNDYYVWVDFEEEENDDPATHAPPT